MKTSRAKSLLLVFVLLFALALIFAAVGGLALLVLCLWRGEWVHAIASFVGAWICAFFAGQIAEALPTKERLK